MQTVSIKNNLGTYKLDFRGSERKRNLFCVLEKLRYSDEDIESEIYERFRLGDDVSFGSSYAKVYGNEILRDIDRVSGTSHYGVLTNGERVFKIRCQSIEDICNLYSKFLIWDYKCHIGKGSLDLNVNYNLHKQRIYFSEEEIVNEFKSDGPGIFDSGEQRFITVVVRKKDFVKFKNHIREIERTCDMSNVWVDKGPRYFKNESYSTFIIN